MSEDDISAVMASVWKVVGTEKADARDMALFELYRQRGNFRAVLQRIAAYPYHGWSQQLAEETLDAPTQVPGRSAKLRNKRIEAAVNRGLAVTAFADLPAGVEMMCRGGVPLEVSKRVLLDPDSRRATDWRSPGDVHSGQPDRHRAGPPRK